MNRTTKQYATCGNCGKKGCDWVEADERKDMRIVACKYCKSEKKYFKSAVDQMSPGNSQLSIMQRQVFAAEHIQDDMLKWKPAERVIPPTSIDEALSQLVEAQKELSSIYHLYEEATRRLQTIGKYLNEQKARECAEKEDTETP
jgi:hypothetical protein